MRNRVNRLRTVLLLGGLSVSVLFVGSLLGSVGLLLAVLVVLGVHGWAYANVDTLALRAMHARPVSQVEQPAMYRIVRELSGRARRPLPRLYVSPTAAPNAFATGRGPRRAAVCVTTGLLGMLDERELRAVLAHELSHVDNRDILVAGVAGALASLVGLVAHLALLTGLFGRDGDERRTRRAPLLVAMLGPLAAGLVRMALSRSREYRADANGVALTGDPSALVSALRTLQAGTQLAPLPLDPRLVSQSHLMIVSPFRDDDARAWLFSTHPPIEERIRRLEGPARARRP